ncbi:EMB2731, partial [Symbiodinium sp. KB8]
YSFSPKAYAKAVLHSCKHSAAPVLGLLLGSANGKVLKVADAIPLFHTHALGPMLKIACMLAEEHCKAAGDLEIVGLYHATPSGSTEMTPVKAIADKLAQNFASASVWTLDASKLPEKQFAFKGLGRSKDEWRAISGDSVSLGSEVLVETTRLIGEMRFLEVVDFDDHLIDGNKSWLNEKLFEGDKLAKLQSD